MEAPFVPPSMEAHWAPDVVVLAHHGLLHVGRLLVARDTAGQVLTEFPLAGVAAAEQHYPTWALGPFSRIEVEGELPDRPGVFALFSDERVRYVGSAENLRRTLGPRGLGRVTRRDCQHTSREDGARLNRRITIEAIAGRPVDLFLLALDTRRDAEVPAAFARQIRAVTHSDWLLPA